MSSFDYSKYSYDELVAEITRLVSEKGTWQDSYSSSTGQVLIQLIAAMTDNLHYMLERRTQESFLPTAKLATSVNAIAGLLGYRPKRKISANGTLTLSLISPAQNFDTISIPKYSNLTFDEINYVNVDDISLLLTQTYPYIFNIKEGTVKEEIFDPSDTNGTLFNSNYITITDYIDIENTSFYITTSTQTFTDVIEKVGNNAAIGTLGFATATDEVYDIRITNSGLRIIFGDGINGEKPVGNLTVKYIMSSGDDVEIVSTGNAFTFNDFATELVDGSSNTYTYTLTNSSTITGGTDEESIEDVRTNAPAFVRTANRAATKDDYAYWTKESGIGSIVDVTIYGEEELGITTVNANNVYITYLTQTGAALTTTQLTDLDNYLDTYKIVTSQLIYETAAIIPLQVNLRVKRNSNLTAADSEVYDFLRNEFITYFAYVDGTLDKELYHSELVNHFYDLTMTKNGVVRQIADYVNLDIYALHSLITPWQATESIPVVFSYVNTNTYTIVINDVVYTYVATGGDTATTLAQKFEQYLDLDVSLSNSETTGTLTTVRNSRDVYNDLLFSEEFSNAVWATTGTMTKVATTLAPDGTSTATILDDTDVGVASYIRQSITGLTLTTADRNVSLLIKKDSNTARFPALKFRYTGGASVETRVSINTQTGATSVVGGAPTVTTREYIDYWRLDVSFANNDLANDTIEYDFYPAYSTTIGGAEDATIQDSCTIWGFQSDNRTSVGNYIRTGVKPINLIYEDSPIENRIVYSERMSETSAWTVTGVTVGDDTTADSDGYTTLDTLTFAGSGTEDIYQDVTNVKSGITYTVSWDMIQGSLTNSPYGIWDNTNSAWIVDPATNAFTLTASVTTYTKDFIVPSTCTSIRIYAARQETTAGTVIIGKSHLRQNINSTTYVPTYNKQVFYFDDYFSITNTGSTVLSDVAVTLPVQLPIPVLQTDTDNQIHPSSIEIIQTDGTVLYTDNGAGVINTTPAGTIDYTTGLMNFPILVDGNYYIRFKQNADDNFFTNERQVFTYQLPKTAFTDTVELLSTITVTN